MKLFINMDNRRMNKLKWKNDALINTKNKCMVEIQTNEGTNCQEVLLVFDLEQNLLNLDQLVEYSYFVNFENDGWLFMIEGGMTKLLN